MKKKGKASFTQNTKEGERQKLHNMPGLPSTRWLLFWVFAISLLVRAVYIYESRNNPTFYTPIVDSQTYDSLARALASGQPLDREFFWQPLFYPLFLALIYKLSNFSILCVKIVQAFLGSLTALLVFQLGKNTFDSRVGLWAGLMTAIYMPLVFFETELLATGWAVFWLVAIVFMMLKLRERPTAWYGIAFGLSGGLAIITRPVILPVFFAGCIWLAFIWIRDHDEVFKAIRGMIPITIGFLLVATPVWILSHRVLGRAKFLPYTGGINFYIGNNPDYKRTIMIRPGLQWRNLVAIPTRYGIEDDHEMEQFFQRKAMDYAVNKPFSFFKGLVYKTSEFFNSREIPRNTDIYLFRKWSQLLSLGVWKAGKFGFPFGLLLPLAFLGLVFHWKKVLGPVGFSLLFYSASVILVFVTSRYRIPLIPVLIVLGSAGLNTIWKLLEKKQWRKVAAASAMLLAVGIACTAFGPFYEEKFDYRAELYYGLGSTFGSRGKIDEAVKAYSRAIELRQDYPEAHYNLAEILKTQGRYEEAIKHYSLSVNSAPDSVEARNNFGSALQLQGKLGSAVQQWEEVLEIDPANPYALFNLGLAMAAQGQYGKAEVFLKKALRERPDWTEIHSHLGLILFQQGKAGEAISHFTEVLRLNPNDVGVHCNLGIALGSQGRFDEAIAHFLKAIKLEPDSTIAHYNLGFAYEMQDRLDEAVAEYRRVLQIDPDHFESRRRFEIAMAKKKKQ